MADKSVPTESLLEKAEAVRAARAARAEARKAEIEAVKLANELVLAELEAQYGDLNVELAAVTLPATGQMVVVKKPAQPVYQRFMTKVMGKIQPADHWDLVKACLVHPTLAEFNALCDAAPGLIVACANACAQLAEVERADVEGK